jgi:hypothetical protein
MQPAAPAPTPPARKQSKRLVHILGYGGTALVFLLIGIAAGGGGSSAANAGDTIAAPAPTVTVTVGGKAPAAATTKKPAAPAAKPTPPTPASATLLSSKGTGIKNTAKFTTDNDWSIAWTYNCSSFGSQGNFQIYVYTDGTMDGIGANELGKKGSDTSPVYDDPGTHYLQINSECAWTVNVTNK